MDRCRKVAFFGDRLQGAAWLSSARVVRCWVKSRNERSPIISCHQVMLGTRENRLPSSEGKEGTTSSHHGLYTLGYTRTYNGRYKGFATQRCEANLKKPISVRLSLQLDSMKSESPVIADQNVAVNTFPDLVHTARQTMEVGCALRQ